MSRPAQTAVVTIMKKHIFSLFVSISSILFFVVGSVLCADDRMWTDNTGKFQIEALLLDFDGKTVKLRKKEDGKVLNMPLEKLSLPDRVYVRKMMNELGDDSSDKTKSEEKSPFDDEAYEEQEKPKSTQKSRSSKTKSSSKSARMKEADESDDEDNDEDEDIGDGSFRGKIPVTRIATARAIRTDLAKTRWSLKPDPSPVTKLDFKPQPLGFYVGEREFGIHNKGMGVCFCTGSPEKVLTAVTYEKHDMPTKTRAFFGDLKSGLVHSQTWPAKLKPLALSPDGTKALFVQFEDGRGPEKKRHLTIVDTTKPKLPCIGALVPFAEYLKQTESFNSEANVEWAEWIDEQHILIQSGDGRLLLLDHKTGAAIWTLDASRSNVPALSGGKKYVLVTCDKFHCILETETGKPIGRLEMTESAPFSSNALLGFSPDGAEIAAFSGGWMQIWDAKTGTVQKTFYVGEIHSHRSKLIWLNEQYLLVGGTLVALSQQLPIWKYTGIESTDAWFAGLYWHAESPSHRDKSFHLWGIEIPHETMPKLPTLADAQKFCVRPGVDVSLNVESTVPGRDAVVDYVTKMLQKNGLNIRQSADISLNVRLTTEVPKETEYRIFGRGFTTEKVTYTPYKMSYTFEQNGKKLWEKNNSVGSPHMIMNRDANQTTQQYVDEQMKPKSDWFLKVVVPQKIPFDKAGTSNIMPNPKR